jgi:DNA (cytosine-5)-methyltransferase 1
MMKTSLPENERELVDKVDEIEVELKKMSASFGRISQIVHELEASVGDPILVENLLLVRAGVAQADTRLFAQAASLFRENATLTKRTIFPETMRYLADLSGDARAEAIRALSNGHAADRNKIGELESFIRRVNDGDERTRAKARSGHLKHLAQGSVGQAIDELELLVDKLMQAVLDFIYCYTPQDPFEGNEVFSDLPGYAKAHREVTARAVVAREACERLFGTIDTLHSVVANAPQEEEFATACKALQRFADGRFGHNGGLAFDESLNSAFSLELLEALQYLGSQAPLDTDQPAALTGPAEELSVLEFGAGAGGMAIGLMAAGFRHRVMYESVKKRAKTLRRSWPDWTVVEKSISQLPDAVLERYRGIDLLAGSIPGRPFARNSTSAERLKEDNHFPDAVRAVRTIRPRAFIFHVVETATFAQHVTYLAGICAALIRLGYKVEKVSLKSDDFGRPLEISRLVIVGIRNDEPGTFFPPTLANPIRKGISAVLGSELIRYETPSDRKHEVVKYSAQWHYNEWANDWRRWTLSSLLPMIPVSAAKSDNVEIDEADELEDCSVDKDTGHDSKTKKVEEDARATRLHDAHIDGSWYAEGPPRVGEVTDNHFRPRLTVASIALAQGFPEGWSFQAALSGNVDMIAEALPPVLARALGLRIYSALTDTKIDLDAALAQPLIDERRVGKRPVQLRAKWKTFSVMQKGEEFLEGEDELADIPDPRARAKARKALMATIVPSKRGRGAAGVIEERADVERMANEIRESRRGDDLNPYGPGE